MVKKKLQDGSECRKCAEITETLKKRQLWHRIDEIIWAHEDDPDSPGMQLGARLGVANAPFFVVRDDGDETVYTSALRLIRERLQQTVSSREEARHIDVDDIGGI